MRKSKIVIQLNAIEEAIEIKKRELQDLLTKRDELATSCVSKWIVTGDDDWGGDYATEEIQAYFYCKTKGAYDQPVEDWFCPAKSEHYYEVFDSREDAVKHILDRIRLEIASKQAKLDKYTKALCEQEVGHGKVSTDVPPSV